MTAELSVHFRRRCDAIATRWRNQLGLANFEPLAARQLAAAMTATLYRPKEVPNLSAEISTFMECNDKWHGVIVSFEPRTILYNPQQSPAGFESTIMHELAHFLLHHPPIKLYALTTERYYREYDDLIEREAAFLGGCLQIPRGGILWAKQGELSKEAIAAHFGASERMVQWRLNTVKF